MFLFYDYYTGHGNCHDCYKHYFYFLYILIQRYDDITTTLLTDIYKSKRNFSFNLQDMFPSFINVYLFLLFTHIFIDNCPWFSNF